MGYLDSHYQPIFRYCHTYEPHYRPDPSTDGCRALNCLPPLLCTTGSSRTHIDQLEQATGAKQTSLYFGLYRADFHFLPGCYPRHSPKTTVLLSVRLVLSSLTMLSPNPTVQM